MYIGKKNDKNRYLRNHHMQFRRILEKYGNTGIDVALDELRQLYDFTTFSGVRAIHYSSTETKNNFKERLLADGNSTN